MSFLQEDTAHEMVSELIAELSANLNTPDVKDEYCSYAPKEDWLKPLIESLQESIRDLKASKTPKVFNMPQEHFDFEYGQSKVERLMKDLAEDLEYHEGIRNSDDQYSDPQEWWLSPLVAKIKSAYNDIGFNAYL